MKAILKPIFEIITGKYVLFDNIIYNYIIMTIIGIISFKIAWNCVKKLYNYDIISGNNIGSIIHWSIRLITFLVIFYFCSILIWITKFVYAYRYMIFICVAIIIVITIIVKLIKKHKKKIKNMKAILDNKMLAIKRKIALFELEKFNQYKTIYLVISLLILIVFICIVSKILLKMDFLLNIDNIYSDTGIALIGMVALIFSLNTYKQQMLYKYMNSVMDRILNDKKYNILQYIIITTIAIIFIFMPSVIHNSYVCTSVYICCLLYTFMIFGFDLVVISNKLDKIKIIKECEKKIKITTKCLEREYKIIKKFAEKSNQKVENDIKFMESFNRIYVAYIQCINMIVRDNINDTIAFEEAMQVYIDITKERLERRKNRITHLIEPLLSEMISTGENDIFIERYILEYLQEYSNIALKEKNRDILSVIQKTYYTLLICGSENKYINNNDDIELTVKIILIYYLNNIEDIVELNNENLLFETTGIMKEIFIKNGDKYASLIDGMYIDKIVEICEKCIEQKSEINLRNSIELLVIPICTLLISNSEYKEVKLRMIYKAIQKVLTLFTNNIKFIQKYNEARLPLNHVFNCLEPISICNIYRDYYNSIIVRDNKINKDILYKEDIFDGLLEFMEKEENIKNVIFLKKTNYYVTIDTDINAIFELIIDKSLRIINLNDESLTKKYKEILKRTLRIYSKYVTYYDEEILQYEIDEFYEYIITRNESILKDSMKEFINNMFFECKLKYTKEEKLKLDVFIKYISNIMKMENEDKKQEKINEIISILTKDDIKARIVLFIKIKKHYKPFEKEEDTKVYTYCSMLMEEQIKDDITKLKKEELIEILKQSNIKYEQDMEKEELIDLILNQKPEKFFGI